MRPALLASFVAMLAVVTWDEIRVNQRVPQPQRYSRGVIIWTILGFASEVGADALAALFGWGLVLTLVYQYYNNGTSPIIGGGNPGAAVGAGTLGPGAPIAGGVGGQVASQ